jgi:hypothetical protein
LNVSGFPLFVSVDQFPDHVEDVGGNYSILAAVNKSDAQVVQYLLTAREFEPWSIFVVVFHRV